MRRSPTVLAAICAVMFLAAPALAHVTVQPTEALMGSFARFVVRVPTERPDASTIKVEVQFPPLTFVSFQDVPGWKRTVKMRELDEPMEVFGEEITEVVATVTWEGGKIEPGEFHEFGFSARMPEEKTTLEFPAIQTYDSGEVVQWTGPADSETPAARLDVLDLGAAEDEGELAVLARLNRAAAQEGQEKAGASGTAAVLGWIGIALGATALAVALVRRRS
jgi:uncharacterized protein YcnI